MNHDLDSLARGPLAIAAALVLALAVLGALTAQGVTQFIVPPPHQVGQMFFTSLKAHNFTAAHEQLSEDLGQQVTVDDLKRLTERLEESAEGIDQASGENPRAQGKTATADVKVRLANGREQTVQVPFRLENGLWHITSLAPLEALAGPPS